MAEDQAPEFQAAPGKDVFISYASQDAAVANAVVGALEHAGQKCWIAPRDVRAGAQYADAIVRALSGAKAIVVVLSANAIASSHVGKEIERASSKKRPIIALRIDAAPLTPALEYFLSESQWIEAQSGTMQAAYAKLIDAIREPAPANSSAASPATPAVAASATQPKLRRNRILLGAGLAVVALTLAALYLPKFWLTKRVPPAQPLTAATNVVSDKSIAVLPFENRSAKQDDAYFTDGIHDDILTQLTKIGAIKVIARTSVEQFRNTQLTTREIGERLGVMRVLEGGVQRAGDRVHVTVQLIDATTDAHLWAESYDRKLTAANIFAIQSEIAAAIASALKAALTPAEQATVNAVRTQNLDAWEAYQLGKQRMAKRTSAGLADAEKSFQRAIEVDPKFALAYAGLADVLSMQSGYSGVLQATALTKAEQAVGTALQLDPNLAEAWASAAGIAADREQFDRAETMYRRAIALNPNYAAAYMWFSGLLSELARPDEALRYAERAVELDPLSAIVNVNLGGYLESAGRFDEAEARYRKVIEIDPSMPSAYWILGGLLAYAFNRHADAVTLGEKAAALDPGNPRYPCWVAGRYLDLGDEGRATRIVQVARERWPDADAPLRVSSFLHLFRGDLEGAVQDARKILARDSRVDLALRMVRDADLKKGDDAIARARYAKAYPEFFATELPRIDGSNLPIAIDLVLVLQKTGASVRASVLLDRIEKFIRTIPRMGGSGYGITDVQIYALRAQRREALSALRATEKAGYRFGWRYYRDFDPDLASIRNEPEFKAVFADIERDMARQRAELAARRRNAPLDFKMPSH